MSSFQRRTIDLPRRGGKGAVALLDFGDPSRPVDIVFSHANGFNALTYRHILEPLATRLRIVAYDLRGHGHTTLPAEPSGRRDWTDLRDDLLAILERLEVSDPVVLAGHSFGGTFSLMAAHEAPEKVRGLVLFDPVILSRPSKSPIATSPLADSTLRRRRRFDSRHAAVSSWRGRGAFASWPDELLADFAQDGLKASADGGVILACSPEWEASSYLAQGQDGPDMLLTTPRPTHLLKAEHHSTCAIATHDLRLLENPLLRLEEIAGTSHFLPMERPDLAREALAAAMR